MIDPTQPPTPDERLKSRPLSPDERDAFLRRQVESQAAQLRKLRDAAYIFPALFTIYGFAEAQHPPTQGLMSYLHDKVRHESARLISKEIADRAMGVQHG